MKAPTGCKTPKRDRDEYALTKADITFMLNHAIQIENMLIYYNNMAENRTGELEVHGNNSDLLEKLDSVIDNIKLYIGDVSFC